MSNDPGTLHGPVELVASLLDGRDAARRDKKGVYGNISDEGLRTLVTLSYFASQSIEEGLYPRFRIYVVPATDAPADSEDPWQLVRFARPILLQEVDDLRRLAPCVASHDFALEAHEQFDEGGKALLVCVGIRIAHSDEGGSRLFSTSSWARHVRPGLMIRVDGPGELRVSEGGRALDLRAGRLTALGGLPVHPVAGWLEEVASRLAEQDQYERYIWHTLRFAWNELLHLASEQRRGGCFVILPKSELTVEDVESQYGIHLKYPTTDFGLGKAIAEFISSCLGAEVGQDASQFKETANSWLRKRHTLLLHVESLAHLSAVDGCTVFDAALQLVGFGGKIAVLDTQEERQFHDALLDAPLDKDIMKQTGTRHVSAFHLCHTHEGVWCYVVSQDGNVTLFWSDSGTVHRWAPYWPWAKTSDHF
jgi:hypothetical protein